MTFWGRRRDRNGLPRLLFINIGGLWTRLLSVLGR